MWKKNFCSSRYLWVYHMSNGCKHFIWPVKDTRLILRKRYISATWGGSRALVSLRMRDQYKPSVEEEHKVGQRHRIPHSPHPTGLQSLLCIHGFVIKGTFWTCNQESLGRKYITELSTKKCVHIHYSVLCLITENWELNIHSARMNCFELEAASNTIFSIKIPLRLAF